MGPTKGRPKKGDLVDMTIPSQAEAPAYELPDPDECVEVRDIYVLDAGHEVKVRYDLWRGRLIVEFAIVQQVRHNGRWVEVARIDSCQHGTVHKHQLRKSRPNDRVGQRIDLETIPAQNGWTMVDGWYDKALQKMQDEWKDNLRRWRRGSA